MKSTLTLLLLLLTACDEPETPATPPPPPSPPVQTTPPPQPGPPPGPPPVPDPSQTPQPVSTDPPAQGTSAGGGQQSNAALYAECKDRVENPQKAGECTSDADCMKAGCGGEVCLARATGEVMSTCEVRPCFAVLDSCGCQEGMCTWEIKPD